MRRTLWSLLLPAILLPVGWPHHLVLGVTNSPGDAHSLRSHARVDARYQYLSGGVNTGEDWTHWNPNGTFASMYVRESISAHMIPVLTFYELLQSKPSMVATRRPGICRTFATGRR